MKYLALLTTLFLLCPAARPADMVLQRYDQGLEQARASQKPLMVQVYADWCRECHTLEAELREHPQLGPLLRRRFVVARLNLGSEAKVRYQGQLMSEKQLAQQLQATWPPMLLFYAPDGKLIGRRIGRASPAEMKTMLDYVLTKAR